MFDHSQDAPIRSIRFDPVTSGGPATGPGHDQRQRGARARFGWDMALTDYDAGSARRSIARSSGVTSTCGLTLRYGSFISRGARAGTAAVVTIRCSASSSERTAATFCPAVGRNAVIPDPPADPPG